MIKTTKQITRHNWGRDPGNCLLFTPPAVNDKKEKGFGKSLFSQNSLWYWWIAAMNQPIVKLDHMRFKYGWLSFQKKNKMSQSLKHRTGSNYSRWALAPGTSYIQLYHIKKKKNIYIYTRGTSRTSIFEGQPLKTIPIPTSCRYIYGTVDSFLFLQKHGSEGCDFITVCWGKLC